MRREIIWPFFNYQQPNLILINLREPSAQQEGQVHGFQGKKKSWLVKGKGGERENSKR